MYLFFYIKMFITPSLDLLAVQRSILESFSEYFFNLIFLLLAKTSPSTTFYEIFSGRK
jgi:hypothetical protein